MHTQGKQPATKGKLQANDNTKEAYGAMGITKLSRQKHAVHIPVLYGVLY
jgi:hypothetical protein